MSTLRQQIDDLGTWYHRIELAPGVVTPAVKDQTLTFALYEALLPSDLNGLRVLDIGANACGLSIEFAKRGASVVAVEKGHSYLKQARFVVEHFDLTHRIEVERLDLYDIGELGQFDIVCFLGLLYHLRYPQLALDLVHHAVKDGGAALISSQTRPGTGASMLARFSQSGTGQIMGWEPTERALGEMIGKAGFGDARLLSSAPHALESPGRVLGNRSYFFARGTAQKAPLPFFDMGEVER